MESYRPGTLEKVGLGPKEVHKFNPQLIYVRLSGYGQQQSHFQLKAGHDQNYLALTGILNKFKRQGRDSNPVFPANILADFAGGSLYTLNLIL